MPTKKYSNDCCSPGNWTFDPEPCACADPRIRSRWSPSMIERMGLYSRHTGLKPIGPHRPLADELFKDVTLICGHCDGDGFIDPGRGDDRWTYCPACDGSGGSPRPGS